MKPNPSYSEEKEFYKRLLWVIIAVVTTIVIYKAIHRPEVKAIFTPSQELTDSKH